MALRPKVPKDLALAPVAAAIDINLQQLRDRALAEIDSEIAQALIQPTTAGSTRDERAAWILAKSVRAVELHGWLAEISDDSARLRLSGGSVKLDLGLSASLLDYIENGA